MSFRNESMMIACILYHSCLGVNQQRDLSKILLAYPLTCVGDEGLLERYHMIILAISEISCIVTEVK